MNSKRIILKKYLLFAWLGLLIILLISMLATIKPYSNYKKAQNLAVDSMLLASDEFDEYKNNKKELLNNMYDYFDPSNYINRTYSEVSSARNKVENALKDILKKEGYDEFYFVSDYFAYTNFFEYYNYKQTRSGFFVVYFILCGVVLIINLIYVLNGKKEILVKDNKIVFKKFPKKEKEFMIKDITSAETTFLKGLTIKGNNIKENVLLLENNEDLKNHIMSLISGKSDKSDSNSSVADELEKYKKLLDDGVITKEEYKKKKEQLLDL